MKLSKITIDTIDDLLRLHSSYEGNFGNGTLYLDGMDALARGYKGAPALKLSSIIR